MLGITVQATDSRAEYDSETGRIKIVQTVEVVEVIRNSSSYGVFEVGDVLISAVLGDKEYEINRIHSVEFMFLACPGDTVVFTVERDGETIPLEITISTQNLTTVQ